MKPKIVQYPFNPTNPPPLTPELLAESARLAALPDETIDYSDIPLKLDWSKGERGKFHLPVKQQVTLRLHADVLHWFKTKGGRDYQTRINAALRQVVDEETRKAKQLMAVYQIEGGQLLRAEPKRFEHEGMWERRDIQRLLKSHIDVLDEGLMVIAEEFGDWVDSSRRIDLLCVDRDAKLVVIELKRNDDGGHMELQALRYAAMVSQMTFQRAAATLSRFSGMEGEAATARLLDHFGWDQADEEAFGEECRIVLASADFGKELTTAVLWLRDFGIDIRCHRLMPCRVGDGPLLLDIQQLIPLPEAASFQTQIGEKKQAERRQQATRHGERRAFWEALLLYARSKTSLHANRSADDGTWIGGSIGRAGFNIIYGLRQQNNDVRLWIDHGPNTAETNSKAFAELLSQREAIEARFGEPLEWLSMPESQSCAIRLMMTGGYRSPQDDWPEIQARMVDAMIRLDLAFRAPIRQLRLD